MTSGFKAAQRPGRINTRVLSEYLDILLDVLIKAWDGSRGGVTGWELGHAKSRILSHEDGAFLLSRVEIFKVSTPHPWVCADV